MGDRYLSDNLEDAKDEEIDRLIIASRGDGPLKQLTMTGKSESVLLQVTSRAPTPRALS